jgi:hypothetical protein
MKKCPKCSRSFSALEYGSQGYCRDCWNRYQALRGRQKRARMKERRETIKRLAAFHYSPALAIKYAVEIEDAFEKFPDLRGLYPDSLSLGPIGPAPD